MPEPTLANKIIATWPAAHAAAVKQLAGVGVNEDHTKRGAHRQRCEAAASEVFTTASVEFKRVQIRITWGAAPVRQGPKPAAGSAVPPTLTKPAVELELITVDGQRFAGAASVDPRKGTAETPPTPAAEVEPAKKPARDAKTDLPK